MHNEYKSFYDQYKDEYGPKMCIFMLCGAFYDMYDIYDKEKQTSLCNFDDVNGILGLKRIEKENFDDNPNWIGYKAGFPDYTLHKWAGKLTSVGWNVIIIDQCGNSNDKGKKARKFSRILSPGTHIENLSPYSTIFSAVLYLTSLKGTESPKFGIGIVDLSTGKTVTYSGETNGTLGVWTSSELIQILTTFKPAELVVYSTKGLYDEPFIRKVLDLSKDTILYIKSPSPSNALSSALYRLDNLREIYSVNSLLPIREYLGLRNENEEIALLYLFQFIADHYPSILRFFHKNEIWQPSEKLICGNHALTQLHITGSNFNETVISLFDKCKTPMGKRAMGERLLRPLSGAKAISDRLNVIKEMMEWDKDRVRKLEGALRFIHDLPRLHRKIICGFIDSDEIQDLFQSYASLNEVFELRCVEKSGVLPKETMEKWYQYIEAFNLHFSSFKTYKLSENISSREITPLNPKTYKDIGDIENGINTVLQELITLKNSYSSALPDAKMLRLEDRTSEGKGKRSINSFGIKISTESAVLQVKSIITKFPGSKIKELVSGGWIESKKLTELNSTLDTLSQKLKKLYYSHILEVCLKLTEIGTKNTGTSLWLTVEDWISQIDCSQCIMNVSKARGYVCPEIILDSKSSFLEIQKLRHPLVESLPSKTPYVKHDISLGQKDCPIGQSSKGWLVYGMNASGKTVVMTAVGISVVLAQAGCFVPATFMRLAPFNSIYTRILNHDNIFAGLSSFAVEMSEMRDILKGVDQYSLVLGDELCSGTESISAHALVASGIEFLLEKNAKFIFATHLHGLCDTLQEAKGLEVLHLHVDYDPITKEINYDRSLRPGPGPSSYGIEVAKAMDLPLDYIERAIQIRKNLMGTVSIDRATTSKWNPQVKKRVCEMCGSENVKDLITHHIDERHTANEDGILPDGTPMNKISNLEVLCEKCHLKRHNSETKSPKCKWTNQEMEIIRHASESYKTFSLKAVQSYLKNSQNITISVAILKKIRLGEY